MKPSVRDRRLALFGILFASVAMTVLAWKGPILGYEDANLMREVGERSWWQFFTDLFYFAYLPFYGLSYWLDTALAGGEVNATFLHFSNALWHAMAGYAAYCVLVNLLENKTGALLGALLFTLHPTHVESAAWIAGRKELVSGFFFFLAWIFQLRAEEEGPHHWIGAGLCFLIACLTKASAIVLPAALLAATWILPRYEGRRKQATVQTLPLCLLALIPLAIHLVVGVEKGVIREIADVATRMQWWVKAWGDSILRTLVPIGLSIEYPEVRSVGVVGVAIGAILVAASFVGALALRRRLPYVSFGLAFFLLALAPFNNIFPATDILAADRYLYLPVFGFALVAGWVVTLTPRALPVATVVVLAFLGLSTWSARRFVSDEMLWTKTIESRPEAAIAWLQRGIDRTTRALQAAPRDDRLLAAGIEDLRAGVDRAVRDRVRAQGERALVLPLLQKGEAGEALQRADRALELVSEAETGEQRRFRAQVFYDRGIVRKSLGGYDVAAQDFTYASQLVPSFLASLEAGRCFLRARQLEEARKAYKAAARADRAASDPWVELAQVERAAGNQQAEHAALKAASDRAPEDRAVVAAWIQFHISGRSPNWVRAKEELKRLPESDPRRRSLEGEIEAWRALYLFRRGEVEKSAEAADAARAAKLSDPRTLYELGEVYMAAARYDEAAQCFLAASDVLDETTRWRDAAARAYTLKAHALVQANGIPGAVRAFGAALDAQPKLIEAGMAPLRGEIELLQEHPDPDLRLLAIAAVAGDPVHGDAAADRFFAGQPEGDARLLGLRLRALLRMFVQRDFRGAEQDLLAVLAEKPDDLWARYRLAQSRMRDGIGWIQTARAIGSESRRKQGEELLNGAIAALGKLIEQHPTFVYARLLRGEAWFSLEDEIGAKADFQRVREMAPGLKEVYLREAVLHRLVYVKGGSPQNLDDGIRILQRALRLDPNYFDALFEVANMYHLLYDRPDAGNMGRRSAFQSAILYYRRAMAVNPRAREPRHEWARICLKVVREARLGGQLKSAHRTLLQVAEDAGDIPELYKERIELNVTPDFGSKTGINSPDAYKGAHEALSHLEQLAPDDPDLPRLRSLYFRRLGASYFITWLKLKDQPSRDRAKELAIDALRRAVEAWPDDPENEQVRVRLRQLAPEFIEIDRKQAGIAYEQGVVHFRAGEHEKAVPYFRRAHRLFPESVELRYMFGLSLARAGRLDAAKDELAVVANSDSSADFPESMFELGRIARAQKKQAIAQAWFERYVAAMEEAGREKEEGVALARSYLEKIRGTDGD
ncbi:MAG: tetratricopeptide repeat protein [Planctomycetota bacterium]